MFALRSGCVVILSTHTYLKGYPKWSHIILEWIIDPRIQALPCGFLLSSEVEGESV